MKKEIDLGWKTLHSMSEEHELEKIEQWCGDLFEQRGQLLSLEIGSYCGKTAALLAQFGPVVCFDLWGDLLEGEKYQKKVGKAEYWDIFVDSISDLELFNQRVFPVVSTAASFFREVWPRLIFDVAFIDGDHHYEAVRDDINTVKNIMNESGLVLFHDYKRPGWGYPPFDHDPNRDPWAGVAKAVDEFMEEEKKRYELFEHYAGVICIRRKKE